MLHEVLLALSGYSGGIYKDNGDGIKVISDLPFIHPSEIALLNKLGQFGTHYKSFQSFIKQYGETLSLQFEKENTERGLHGLYLKAFCHGLDDVLSDYRRALVELEKSVLSDPHLALSHLYMSLQQFQILFSSLSAVIEQIKSHNAHGCYIMDIVHQASKCGDPLVKDSLNRILHICHGCLFKQLCSWLFHGSLFDPYNEFFIQQRSGITEDLVQNITDDDDDLGITGITGRQLQKMLMVSEPATSSASHQFSIQGDLMLSYIPLRVVNKILFIGESVQLFESDSSKSLVDKKESIMKNKEEKFAKDLYDLSQQEQFSIMGFETLIDNIRLYVAEELWILVVEESKLIAHLKIIKDFYLLGRGELYLALIDQAQSLMRHPPTGTTEHDVNVAFQQAARNVLIQDDALIQSFHLTISTKPEQKSSVSSDKSLSVETGWNYLGLSHTVKWPLHIFFTTAVLDKYNKVFKFLLVVKRTSLELQHCWALQMRQKHKARNQSESSRWQLRNHMSFLVDNLQYFLQVDVIESLCGMLLDKVRSTRDYEAIRFAHDHFLTCLLSQSFVNMRPVHLCLLEILNQCNMYCSLIKVSDRGMCEKDSDQLQIVTQNFQRQSNLLFNILTSVRTHNSSPHLAQLLLRLDFNKFFTSSGGQLGSL